MAALSTLKNPDSNISHYGFVPIHCDIGLTHSLHIPLICARCILEGSNPDDDGPTNAACLRCVRCFLPICSSHAAWEKSTLHGVYCDDTRFRCGKATRQLPQDMLYCYDILNNDPRYTSTFGIYGNPLWGAFRHNLDGSLPPSPHLPRAFFSIHGDRLSRIGPYYQGPGTLP